MFAFKQEALHCDITELKRSERELKRTEAEKTLILNITSELVTYFDLDLRIKWLNSAAIEALGRNKGDLLGRPCYEVWHQRTEPCTNCPVVQAKLTGKPQQSEIVTPDGRIWLARGYAASIQEDLTARFDSDLTDHRFIKGLSAMAICLNVRFKPTLARIS